MATTDIVNDSLPPPTSSLTFKSLSENNAKNVQHDRENELYSYKKHFDQNSAQIGIMKPAMGGAGYKNKILNGASSTNAGSINLTLLSQKPLLNLLHVPGLKEKGVLTRYLYYFYITTSRQTDLLYPSMESLKRQVLQNEKLDHAIQMTLELTKNDQSNNDRFLSDAKLKTKLLKKAKASLNEMVATVTSGALQFCGWLMLTLLRQVTSAVHIHQGQLEVLKFVLQEGNPVIYFPLHFSHFDYILLSLIMYHKELRCPFVASGNNLLIQPFSYIMRRVGGFFIRRKIGDAPRSRDMIYRAVLHSYFTELLRNNQSLEIFIEGTRSRSGLPALPKTGLLSVAVEALLNGKINDITMVPVCISYEKLLEGTFRNEIMGRPKQPETLLWSVTSICKMLFGFYGHIRVNFGVPQSMKKTLYELRNSPACLFNTPLTHPLLKDNPGISSEEKNTQSVNVARKHKMGGHDSAPIIQDGGVSDLETRELVCYLGERLVYSSLTCKVFMSTNLVSFLLLHRWRTGILLSQLVDSFRHLTVELFRRKNDVGFSGDYTDVVLHALDLLGTDLVMPSFILNLKKTDSSLSVQSRRSADSGYDGTVFETPRKKRKSDPDIGEELSHSEYEVPITTTGSYMSLTEEGNVSNVGLLSDKELQNPLLKRRSQNKQSNVPLFINPILKLPNIFDLAYYANALTPVFALDSVVAISVSAVLGCRFSPIEKKLCDLNGGGRINNKLVKIPADNLPEAVFRSFTRACLVDKALDLVDILQMDLIMCDVTVNLEAAINEAIDSLTSCGCLTSEEYGNTAATRKSQSARELGFDENDCENDTWMKVNLEQLPLLISWQSVLSSFVEGYVAAATQLIDLLEKPLKESELKSKMLLSAQNRVHLGLAVKIESCSSDVIRNALRSFQWNNIVVTNSDKEYHLSTDYQDIESIMNLISRMSQFLP